jgi:hypothetical protein
VDKRNRAERNGPFAAVMIGRAGCRMRCGLSRWCKKRERRVDGTRGLRVKEAEQAQSYVLL